MIPYTLEIIVFVASAVIMILEIAGARILAPHLGTSIYTWTALIGIILASLSLGNVLGGKLADHRPDMRELARLLFFSGMWIAMIAFMGETIMSFVTGFVAELRLSAVIGASILFALPSVLLGMITPFAIRVKIHSLKTSGKTIGSLSALSALGSIAGTFLAGFFLLSYLGSDKVLLSLTIILFVLSLVLSSKRLVIKSLLAVVFLIVLFTSSADGDVLFEGDTSYSHVQVFDVGNTRLLKLNGEHHSAVFLDNPELVFDYTQAYLLATLINPDPKKTLMIGGGAFTFPSYFVNHFPGAHMDVVEIDSDLKDIAQTYFGFQPNPRLNLIFEDGRMFLNRNQKKYDIVFVDAFSSYYSLPFHLTTVESLKHLDEALTDKGVLAVNVISSIEGERGLFLQAFYKTAKEVFPYVYLYPVTDAKDASLVQNILLFAFKEKPDPTVLSLFWQETIPQEDVVVLTDRFAPTDRYLTSMMLSLFSGR